MKIEMRAMRFWVVMSVAVVALCGMTVQAGVIVKANNTDALNLTTSWVGGVVPGSGDVAQWDNTVTAGAAYSLGGSPSWSGMRILDSVGAFSINSGGTLTLGADGLYSAQNLTYTFNNAMALSADQTWTSSQGLIIVQLSAIDMGGRNLTLTSVSTAATRIQIKCAMTNGGTMTISTPVKFTGGSAAAPSTDVTLIPSGSLTYETGNGSVARTGNMFLKGGSVTLATIGSNLVETNAVGATTICSNAPASVITITSTSSKHERLYSGSLTRQAGGVALLKGSSLGVYTMASLTANSSSIELGTAPTLVGGGGGSGSTTCSILVGALGDTTTAGSGLGITGGLFTYDSTYGLRLLSEASEYKSSITDGQVALDNVRILNTSPDVSNVTVSTATTINSLSIAARGTNSGALVTGGGMLTLNSGVMYVSDTNSAAPGGNAVILTNLTLNLGGKEGVILYANSGANTDFSATKARFDLDAAITNDGGNGITIYGSGNLRISGAEPNAYTGPTVVVGGSVQLIKKAGVDAIPGHLLINGGGVYNTGNQLPDTSDIIIDGSGAYQLRANSSTGTGASEGFRDLYLRSAKATYGDGASGTSSGRTTNRNTTISGGYVNITKGHRTVMTGSLVLNGGNLRIGEANDATTTYLTWVTVSNGVTIYNTASGVYSAITNYGGTVVNAQGGKLFLPCDLTFVGNSNTNTAYIVGIPPTAAGASNSMIAVSDARTFNIGDGSAAIDLAIQSSLIDGAPVGAVTKSGAGTLALYATNTYTGATTVNNGTLIIDGLATLASATTVDSNSMFILNGVTTGSVTVNSNAVFTGTGTVSSAGAALTVNAGGIVDPGSVGGIGTMTVTGNVAFASGGKLRLDANGGSADKLVVTGTVTSASSTVAVTVNAVGNGPWLVMTAANIVPSFTATVPEMILSKQNNNTELWLYRGGRGTALIIF